jgi:membrane protease YdiL (CAAX protease family)
VLFVLKELAQEVQAMVTLPQTSLPPSAFQAFRAFIKRHPALTYYVLAFAISWGSLLMVAAPGGIPGPSAHVSTLFPFAILGLLGGPSIAGIVMTGLVSGRSGLRALLSRLLSWHVGARWYAMALLTIPLVAAVTLFALSLTSPAFLPAIVTSANKASLLLAGLAVGLSGAVAEELGWTGFAVPALRQRHGVLTTGLIVGLLWGVWHVPITFWASGTSSGALSLDSFLPPLVFYMADLLAYRVLMVWVYDRTESLLLAILMHTSLIASTLFILAPQPILGQAIIYNLVVAVILWIVVGVVVVANSSNRSRGENTRAISVVNDVRTPVAQG